MTRPAAVQNTVKGAVDLARLSEAMTAGASGRWCSVPSVMRPWKRIRTPIPRGSSPPACGSGTACGPRVLGLHGEVRDMERRTTLTSAERALLTKLRAGTWLTIELQWVLRHLDPRTPTLVVQEIHAKLIEVTQATSA
jgi:hypothetical protein